MTQHQCQCDAPGWCEYLNRQMNARALNACRGLNADGSRMDPVRHAITLRQMAKHGGRDDLKIQPIPATPEQFPCIYRESLIDEVPCQVCGQRNKTANLYACALHGKCTVGSHGVTQDGTNATAKVKVCISCDDINGVG